MTWIFKSGGKQTQVFRSVVARDGKTMTISIDAKDANGKDSHTTVVYEKQSSRLALAYSN